MPGWRHPVHILLALRLALLLLSADGQVPAPPVYGAYPTGGPVDGGTSVTIVGREFTSINRFVSDARCSWGDPRSWQQTVFAEQQAEMDGWAASELDLPAVPPSYFTTPTRLETVTWSDETKVSHELRSAVAVPSGATAVDILVCSSFARTAGDVSLWFSLSFTQVTGVNTTASRLEPNLMDTGATFMYYPAPRNFSNWRVTGGPIHGSSAVVIEGTGFTLGYRSQSDIDLTNLIVRCRWTDKPSVVSFRRGAPSGGCPDDAATDAAGTDSAAASGSAAEELTVVFDAPTSGREDQLEARGTPQLSRDDVDALFRFHEPGGATGA